MATQITTGVFKLTAIMDGSSFSSRINSTKPLLQFLDDTVAFPDWTLKPDNTSESPLFWLQVFDNSTEIAPKEEKLYYGDLSTPVEFSDSIYGGWYYQTGVDPMLRYMEEDGYRKFQFIKNVASEENQDNDTIMIVGKIKRGGRDIEIASPATSVQIKPTGGGSVYAVYVEGADITDPKVGTTLTANLYGNNSGDITNDVTWEWHNMTGGTGVKIDPPAANGNKCHIGADDVNGFDLFRATARINGGDSVCGYIQIRDMSDPYFIRIDMSDAADDGYLSPGETVTIRAVVVNTKGESVEKAGKTFKPTWTLIAANGNDASGLIDTETNNIVISYEQLVSLGGGLDGYVTGEFVND